MSRVLQLILICLFPTVTAIAQEQDNEEAPARPRTLPDHCKAFTHKGMPYRLLIPKGYDATTKYPLVLCLHGARGRGDDNMGRGTETGAILIADDMQQRHPCFVLIPQCPRGKQWVNIPWRHGSYDSEQITMSDELTLALDIVDEVTGAYSIDADRVYVAGQSMGGYGAWDALIRRPDTFAAAIINCGAGDPGKADLIKDVPIWNFHGDQDALVPVSGSREMVEAIRRVGGKQIIYTELAGAGHYARIMQTPGLVDWLFSQKRANTSAEASP